MQKTKRRLALLLATAFLAVMARAVPTARAAGKTELIVFAAASLSESLTEIGKRFEAARPDMALTFVFDSSGTLKTQIQEGAPCDVFVSASLKTMQLLEKPACDDNTDRGYILADTKINLLRNEVVLAGLTEEVKGVKDFETLMEALKAGRVLLSMGNSDVPVGQYTLRLMKNMDVDDMALAKAGVISYAGNVKEVVMQVKEGAADVGVVYKTDAKAAGLTVMAEADTAMVGEVIYPAAVVKASERPEEAKAFLAYLQQEEAGGVFSSFGFTPLNP